MSKGFDVRLICYYLALVIIGWITIYSTCYIPDGSTPIFDFGQPYSKQMLWIGTSIVLATIILLIDSGIIQHYAYFFYLFCLNNHRSSKIKFGKFINGNLAFCFNFSG